MASDKGKGKCDACGRDGVRRVKWHELWLCATCSNIGGQVRNHRAEVDYLYNRVHRAAPPVAGEKSECVECDHYLEIIAAVRDALGGNHIAGELAGAVRDLVKRAAVMEGAVQAAENMPAACDPTSCSELDKVNELITDIALAFDGGTGTCRFDELPLRVGELVAAVRSAAKPCTLEQNSAGVFEMIEPEKNEDSYAVPAGYERLFNVYCNAMHQAAHGKGKERHARPGVPFELQTSCSDARELGIAYPIGQARKKALESARLTGAHQLCEILGAINYLAIAYIIQAERLDNLVKFPAPADLVEIQHLDGAGME